MSWFSSLFQSSTAFYGDPFGPLIDVVQDWGWSILPQTPGWPQQGSGGGHVQPGPVSQPVVVAPVPVAYEPETWGIEGSPTGVYPVFNGHAGPGPTPVPPKTVVVEGLPTEVEQHPEGDYPAGSIFAPGRIWGAPVHELDTDPYPETDMALDWGGIVDWGLDTLTGQQPWQTFGQQQQLPIQAMGFAAPNYPVPTPSGIPGQPTTITGYTGGSAVTGDNCGNRRYVTLDRETGKISCKRRRRRRLLTNRDLADLASLKTITGGGAALNAAVIRAVR